MANKFQEFLVKAHKATYASGGKPQTNSNGANQFIYTEGDFEYIDTYYGGPNFVGCEIVKEKGRPVWGMSYYGYTEDITFDNGEFMKFFKKTISKTIPGILLRGPKKCKEKEWSYRYNYKGSIGNFKSEEIIKHKGKKVFCVRFNGGLIK